MLYYSNAVVFDFEKEIGYNNLCSRNIMLNSWQ